MLPKLLVLQTFQTHVAGTISSSNIVFGTVVNDDGVCNIVLHMSMEKGVDSLVFGLFVFCVWGDVVKPMIKATLILPMM